MFETSPRTQQDWMLPSSTAFTLRVYSVTESGRFSGASPSGSGCAGGMTLADPVDGDRGGGNDADPVRDQLEVPVEDALARDDERDRPRDVADGRHHHVLRERHLGQPEDVRLHEKRRPGRQAQEKRDRERVLRRDPRDGVSVPPYDLGE